MHRTTIPLDGPIEKELRKLAIKERQSFKDIVNELLRKGLKAYKTCVPSKVHFKWNTAKGKPIATFDPSDRSTYLDILSRKIK